MIRRSLLLFIVVAIGLGVLTACGLLSPEPSYLPTHPQDNIGSGRPLCSSCHENETSKVALKSYASFDHTPAFVKDHRFQAYQDSGVCASCHAQSFCAPCHAGKTMMKPSTLLGNRPDRESPHRGDYLTLHRMEGKMDPTSCYTCHGRANNEKCTTCHK